MARLSGHNQTSAHVVGDLAQAHVELATICEPSPPRFARCCWTPTLRATAHLGVSALDRGEFKEFADASALVVHLNRLADDVASGAEGN